MDELESKLRQIPLREPSRDLDERVMAQKPESRVAAERTPWRAPTWLTAAVAVVMGLAGFAAGAAWRGQESPKAVERAPAPPVTIQVIYNSPASGNPFDFTRASDIFPAGEMEAKIAIEKGA